MSAPRVEIEVKTSVTLDIELAARWFANISDDDAAKFFTAVAAEVKHWPGYEPYRASFWFSAIGNHLATCKCASEEAREMLREIVAAMDVKQEAA